MLNVEVYRVQPCSCGHHATVLLRDSARGRVARLRVEAATGRAVTAQLQGLPLPWMEAFDLLGAALQATGARPTGVIVRLAGDEVYASLCLHCPTGEAIADVSVAHALLAACRLGLPILADVREGEPADEPEPDTVPQVFRDALKELLMDG